MPRLSRSTPERSLPGAGGLRVHQPAEAGDSAREGGAAELMSAAALSELIGAIYDCALDPDRWPDTLSLIRQTLGFHNAVLQLQALPSGEVLLNVGSGVEQPWLDRMIDYGPDVLAQWGGEAVYHGLPLEEPAVLSWVRPKAMAETRFELEWGRPQGLIDVMAIVLARDAGALGSIGMGRHERSGPIGQREVAMARLLIPHLQRAATISGLLDSKTLVARTLEALIDRLAVPILLVGDGMRIVHANAAADRLLETGDPLQSKGGRLAPRSDGVAAALAVAVEQGRADESALGRKGFGVPAHTAEGALRVLHVLPLQFGDLRPGLAPSAVAAVFVAPTMPGLPARGDVLASLFNLTPAEARVFELIAAGRTSAEAARALGVGASTVKTHLLRLFDKLGVRRQADLVALAASFALPVDSAGPA